MTTVIRLPTTINLLTFYVLSQLVDIQIDHNRSLHQMVGLLKRQSKLLETLTAQAESGALHSNDLSRRKERIAANRPPAETGQTSPLP